MTTEQAELQKRARGSESSASVVATNAQPMHWPSQAELVGRGLQGKAEVQGTSSGSLPAPGSEWVVPGAAWRAEAFQQADTDSMTLRQRQAEARRAMLKKPSEQF